MTGRQRTKAGGGLVTELKIDITDWVDDMVHTEEVIETQYDVVRLVQQMPTGRVASLAIAGRANGRTPDKLFSPDKILLYAGAREEVARMVKERHCEATAGEQKLWVREFIGPHVTDEGGHEDQASENAQLFVKSLSEEGAERAARYLLKVVPGHVVNHLQILAGYDMARADDVMDQLLEKLDALRESIVEAVPA